MSRRVLSFTQKSLKYANYLLTLTIEVIVNWLFFFEKKIQIKLKIFTSFSNQVLAQLIDDILIKSIIN